MDLLAKIRSIPTEPGVYLYKNAEGEVIYVGKAKNLRSRVASYFHEGRWEDSKTGTLVREHYTAYSADHNSVTVTDGSGPSAITHTTYTDPDGHTLLAIANPAPGATEFTLNQYDLAGNLVSADFTSAKFRAMGGAKWAAVTPGARE